MASWREIALGFGALWLPACTLMAGNSVPADRAENAPPVQRAGVVKTGPDGAAALLVLEEAVRDDALRAWPGVQRPQLLLRSEALSWADASLGCPRPGLVYTQAVVPGWRITVKGQGREAVYHASQRGQWLLCPNGQRPSVRAGDLTR